MGVTWRPERAGFWHLYLAGALSLAGGLGLLLTSFGPASASVFALSVLTSLYLAVLAELELAGTYSLTEREVRVERSPLLGGVRSIPLGEVVHVSSEAGPVERAFGVGSVKLASYSRVLVLRGVRDPKEVEERIRRAVAKARRRRWAP